MEVQKPGYIVTSGKEQQQIDRHTSMDRLSQVLGHLGQPLPMPAAPAATKVRGVSPVSCAAAGARKVSMKALVLEKKNELRLREIEVDEPFTPHDVRVAIKSVGICGSDMHYYRHGAIGPYIMRQPMILGHECSGVVLEVGSEVRHLKVGDRVFMEPGVPDMNSKETLKGMYNLDRDVRFWATPPKSERLLKDPCWSAGHGVLRASVVHPAAFTYKLPDNVSFDEGAMVEPLAVGVHAAQKAAIQPGSVAVVIGAGPIGMLQCLAALAAGCAKVFVVDVNKDKLPIAEALAAKGKIVGIWSDPKDEQRVVNHVMKATDGWGADVVFECSGNDKVYGNAVNVAAPGGVIVLVGCPSCSPPLNVGNMQCKELRIETIFRYANVMEKTINLLGSGQVDVKPIITNRFSFAQAKEAFDFMLNPPATTVKTVIQVAK